MPLEAQKSDWKFLINSIQILLMHQFQKKTSTDFFFAAQYAPYNKYEILCFVSLKQKYLYIVEQTDQTKYWDRNIVARRVHFEVCLKNGMSLAAWNIVKHQQAAINASECKQDRKRVR